MLWLCAQRVIFLSRSSWSWAPNFPPTIASSMALLILCAARIFFGEEAIYSGMEYIHMLRGWCKKGHGRSLRGSDGRQMRRIHGPCRCQASKIGLIGCCLPFSIVTWVPDPAVWAQRRNIVHLYSEASLHNLRHAKRVGGRSYIQFQGIISGTCG